MYYWEEKYENIWDYAPNPRRDKAAGGGRRGALKCVCKETSLTEQLDRFVDVFVAITPPGVADALRAYFKGEICCCTKNYCKHEDQPIPEEDLNDDLWELYTFFLNEFNTMDSPSLNGDDATEVTTSDLRDNLFESAHAVSDDDVKANSAEPEGRRLAEMESQTATVRDGEASRDDAADKGQNNLLLSPYFKLKVMEMVMDCMKQRDVHRYFLLQHIRLLLHLYKSLLANPDSGL